MANETLGGLKVAILIEDGFEQVEMVEPRKALDQAGAETRIVSPRDTHVRAWNDTEWGDEFPVDVALDQAKPHDFDALLLPGGVLNPDALRIQPKAVAFAKAFFDAGKPVAAICHGPWTIIETGVARGRQIASWPSLKTDLRNAGAVWMDQQVVVDGNLVSSRKPDDIPAFNRAMIGLFGQARGKCGERRKAGGRHGTAPVRFHEARGLGDRPGQLVHAPYATLILRIGLAVLFLAHAGRKLCVFKMAGSVTYFQPLSLPGWIACVTLTLELSGGIALIAAVYARSVAPFRFHPSSV